MFHSHVRTLKCQTIIRDGLIAEALENRLDILELFEPEPKEIDIPGRAMRPGRPNREKHGPFQEKGIGVF